MAACGIERIDRLLSPQGGPSIAIGERDREAVGAIQDLLSGHGQRGLPNFLSPEYGIFGQRTADAVVRFCAEQGLSRKNHVDEQTLRSMVETTADSPILCRAYVTLVLDLPYTGLTKILSVVSQMEGAGRFAALNLNTDAAGLSFGLIQWAQKPGRLSEILAAFMQAQSTEFVRIFGAGDAAQAHALLLHTRKRSGGVDPHSGETTDPAFDLVEEPWVGRFRQAVRVREFQVAQVQTGLAAFSRSLGRLKSFASALRSERGVAFLLDLTNQFGDGGARSIYQAAQRDGMAEAELLAAMSKESLRRIQSGFQRGHADSSTELPYYKFPLR